MHKIIILLLVVLSHSTLLSQVKFGIRGGISTYDIGSDSITISGPNNGDIYSLAIEQASYGFHAGLVLQININGFILQPEVLYNSNRVDFKLRNNNNNLINILSERYQYLDIPLLFGTKAGPLRLNLGPVGHVFLESTSNLLDIEGYKEDFKTVTWGFQAGLGLDFWKFFFDIRYEGNFSHFGDHINFFGQSYAFTERPRRLIASIAFVF
jgi:hypothetical protein